MTGFPAAALFFSIMNNQNNNRNYSRSDEYYGRRARSNVYSDNDRGNFDVGGDQPPRRARQDYGSQGRQQYPRQGYYGQGYSDRSRQPYPPQQGDRNGGRQPYPPRQGYQSQGRQQYPSRQGYRDYYDGRTRQPRPQNGAYGRSGYDDGYNRRPQGGYDNRPRPRGRRPKKRTSTGVIVVRVIAIIMLLVGAGIIGTKLYHYYSDKKGHMELQQLSTDYEALYAKNHDFFGWLKIDDTVIDYPVMYVQNDNDKYLHTDFDGDRSESGELFMDGYCNPNGLHYLIYGHHMFNGSMFGSLPKFDNTEYYNEHKIIHFNTRFEKGDYEIFAIFYSQIYDANDNTTFQYYECRNLDDEQSYNYYVQNVKALSSIDTGITPHYGEKIITLSTCNYHTQDGRFVVCARKIS